MCVYVSVVYVCVCDGDSGGFVIASHLSFSQNYEVIKTEDIPHLDKNCQFNPQVPTAGCGLLCTGVICCPLAVHRRCWR